VAVASRAPNSSVAASSSRTICCFDCIEGKYKAERLIGGSCCSFQNKFLTNKDKWVQSEPIYLLPN
jgi:hypothetical protein